MRIIKFIRHLWNSGEVSFQKRFAAVKISQDGTQSVRTKDSSGNATEADIDDQGHITGNVQGRSPQGEEGSLTVCEILIEYLNQLGANWAIPHPDNQGERGIDCVSEREQDHLLIQVTRIPDAVDWKGLNKSGAASIANDVSTAISQLQRAIEGKATIDPSLRRSITLVIDAMRTPAFATPPVVHAFKAVHGQYIDSLAFKSIWVVGPVASTVYRLDSG
jgi:hypothetical protein